MDSTGELDVCKKIKNKLELHNTYPCPENSVQIKHLILNSILNNLNKNNARQEILSKKFAAEKNEICQCDVTSSDDDVTITDDDVTITNSDIIISDVTSSSEMVISL